MEQKILIFFFLFTICMYALEAQNLSSWEDSKIPNQWQLQTSRMGVNSIGLNNRFHNQYRQNPNNTSYVTLQNEWLHNEGLDKNPFIQRDLITDMTHSIKLNEFILFNPEFFYNDYRSSQTSIGGGIANLGIADKKRVFTSMYRIGYVADKRTDITDAGLLYGTDFHIRLKEDSLLKTGILFSALKTDIHPRENYNLNVSYFLNHKINNYADYGLNFGYTQKEVEDYYQQSIQNIRSDSFTTGLDFRYVLLKGLTFVSENMLLIPSRNFNYIASNDSVVTKQSSLFKESIFNSGQALYYLRPQVKAGISYAVNTRKRNYGLNNNLNKTDALFEKDLRTEKSKDITEDVAEWRANLSVKVNRIHTLQGKYIAQLIRIDTPSPINDQDKDELFYLVEGGLISQWYPNFQTSFLISGNFKKHAFIKSSNSINNFVQRSLKYEPGFVWNKGVFTWNGKYGLLVTYHVKDFKSETDKNRSNRQFTINQIFTLQTSYNSTIKLHYLQNQNYLSRFDWDRFSESPLDSTFNYDIMVYWEKQIQKKQNKMHFLKGGYRYFYQVKTSLGSLTEPQQTPKQIYVGFKTVQHGPELGYRYEWSKGLSCAVSCWFQYALTFYNYVDGEGAGLFGQRYTTDDLSKNTGNFYPYFDVSVSWRLGVE